MSHRSRRLRVVPIVAGIALLAAGFGDVSAASLSSSDRDSAGTAPAAVGWVTTRTGGPARTEVRDAAGTLLAELTDGARTVTLAGPARSWTEAGTAIDIRTDRWVRLLPAPYDGIFDAADTAWVAAALGDRSPDILAVAFQYVSGAPPLSAAGLVIAGDARYGDAAGADFNDFLGVAWTYGSSIDAPEPAELRSLDCSGFVRMVLGYRFGMRMSIGASAGALPRRAFEQLASGPGRLMVANSGRQLKSYKNLRAGDLVFFDASTVDGTAIDHVGIYVGRDAQGHHRFISSRQKADGPTVGDVGGKSVLDGSGYWALAFRAVRRP
ncbi:MAG: C40 family peptidase [Chloroflexi bacterium]|nr:C40 family peptidase [Chloroflexota bacterium]